MYFNACQPDKQKKTPNNNNKNNHNNNKRLKAKPQPPPNLLAENLCGPKKGISLKKK